MVPCLAILYAHLVGLVAQVIVENAVLLSCTNPLLPCYNTTIHVHIEDVAAYKANV